MPTDSKLQDKGNTANTREFVLSFEDHLVFVYYVEWKKTRYWKFKKIIQVNFGKDQLIRKNIRFEWSLF